MTSTWSVFSVATLILLVAKLTGFFPYSWLWVFAPLGVGVVLFVIALLFVIAVAVISA